MGNFQNSFLAERFAEQLQADGQSRRFCETARQTDAANAREIARIVKMSDKYICNGSIGFFADFERSPSAKYAVDNGIPLFQKPSKNR